MITREDVKKLTKNATQYARMMNENEFDTLEFVKRLKQSGFNEEQAEALSEAFKDSQETTLADLATKQDLKELEMRMTLRMGLMLAASIGIIAALVKLL